MPDASEGADPLHGRDVDPRRSGRVPFEAGGALCRLFGLREIVVAHSGGYLISTPDDDVHEQNGDLFANDECEPETRSLDPVRSSLAFAYEALHDLADALDWPLRWVGLGGLRLYLDATNGAAEDYDVTSRTITLLTSTRHQKGFSLAHQWAHALDHRLSRHANGGRWPQAHESHYLSDYTKRHDLLNALPPKSQAAIRAMSDLAFACRNPLGDYLGECRKLAAMPGLRSRQQLTATTEMLARSFEACVSDWLERLDLQDSDCVGPDSHQIQHAHTDADADADPFVSAYPKDHERMAFDGSWRKMLDVLRENH